LGRILIVNEAIFVPLTRDSAYALITALLAFSRGKVAEETVKKVSASKSFIPDRDHPDQMPCNHVFFF
jgi:hypothetical protein